MLSKYQLIINNSCGACIKILTELKKEEITIQTVNIDIENYALPHPLLIFPALLKDDKLISYGAKDIIAHLKQQL